MAEEITIKVTAQDNFSGVLGDFGNIITGIRSAVSLAADAFAAIIAPVIDFGKESILAAARVEELQVVNQLLGKNAGISSKAVTDAAEAVRSMGIEAGVSQQVIAEFIKANLDIADAADIARVAQDAAVISGLNSTEVTERIIHGIVTLNPLILRNAGIIVDLQTAYKNWADENDRTVDSLSTAEKQQIALNAVMEAGEGIAGAYAAAMEEPGKVLRSFPRYFDDIMVAIGEPFQDAFGEVIFSFADLAKWIGEAVSEGGELRPILEGIAEGAANFAETFAGGLGGIIDYFTDLTEKSTEIKEVVKDVLDPTGYMSGRDWVFPDKFITDLETEFSSAINWDLFATNLINDMGTAILGAEDWEPISKAFEDGLSGIDWGNVFSEVAIEGMKNIDWTEAGVTFGEGLRSMFEGETGKIDWFSLITEPIVGAFEFLVGWFAGFWKLEVSASIEEAGQQWGSFFKGLGTDVKRGFIEGLGSFADWWHSFWASFISDAKEIFGIASPSTVFYEIGRNLISGLMLGITSMLGGMLAFIGNVVDLLLSPFAPLLDVLGITSGGSVGTADTINWGGGTPATEGGGARPVNNYYYGPVYFGSTGEPNIYYDCPSPNPLMTAGGSNLVLNP